MNEKEKHPAILYVEDIGQSLFVLKKQLQAEFTVIGASNVEEALARLSENSFSLILMDINLGEPLDGLSLALSLKSDERYKHIPIVGFTAYFLENEIDTLKEHGLDDLLLKPASREQIISKIRKNMV